MEWNAFNRGGKLSDGCKKDSLDWDWFFPVPTAKCIFLPRGHVPLLLDLNEMFSFSFFIWTFHKKLGQLERGKLPADGTGADHQYKSRGIF
jgi:hypothetical protein